MKIAALSEAGMGVAVVIAGVGTAMISMEEACNPTFPEPGPPVSSSWELEVGSR